MNLKLNIFIFLSVLFVSCKPKVISSTDKIPPVVTNINDITKIIVNKKWQVIDVAIIGGSATSRFRDDKPKIENITAPKLADIKWLSENKKIETSTDFIDKFYKESFDKFKKISISFNNDSIATHCDTDTSKQIFVITNDIVEKEPNGMKLKLSGTNKSFNLMNFTRITTTYYILGANDKTLYLLSPNKINDEKVVFLLEQK